MTLVGGISAILKLWPGKEKVVIEPLGSISLIDIYEIACIVVVGNAVWACDLRIVWIYSWTCEVSSIAFRSVANCAELTGR